MSQPITPKQLETRLRNLTGSTIVSIVADTAARMRKTRKNADGEKHVNPWFGHVRKISHVTGFINGRYASMVNRQRDREGNPQNKDGSVEHFFAMPRTWGKRIDGTPFVRYVTTDGVTKLYLEIKVQHCRDRYVDSRNGSEVSAETLEPWLKTRSTESQRQEIEREIVLRDFCIWPIDVCSVREICIKGEFFRILTADDAADGSERRLAA